MADQATQFDTVLIGGLIMDGTGADAVRADVAIAGNRIAAIGDLTGAPARHSLDVSDRVVAPGFIDVHTMTIWRVSAIRR